MTNTISMKLMVGALMFTANAWAGLPPPNQPNPGDIPMQCYFQPMNLDQQELQPFQVSTYLDEVYHRAAIKNSTAVIGTVRGLQNTAVRIASTVGQQSLMLRMTFSVMPGVVVEANFLDGSLTDNIVIRRKNIALPMVGSCRISFH